MFMKFNLLPLITSITAVTDAIINTTGRQPSWIVRLLECTVEPEKVK